MRHENELHDDLDEWFEAEFGITFAEHSARLASLPKPPLTPPSTIMSRMGLEIGPDGYSRKISESRQAANDPQPVTAQGFEADCDEATPLVPSPTSTTPSHHTPTHLTSIRSGARARGPVTRLHVPANQNLQAWRYLPPEEKDGVCLDYMEAAGARAFRLTFSLKKETELRRAAASGQNIRQMIADAIADQFRRRFGVKPAFGFCIEEAPRTNRLHIHGVYMTEADLPADAIREAFCHAGGNTKGQAGSTQFWHHPVYDARRYWSYSRKDETSVMRRLSLDGVTFINDPMRAIGRKNHEAARVKPKVVTMRKPVVMPALSLPAAPDEILSDEDLDMLATDMLAREADSGFLTQEGTLQTLAWFSAGTHPTRAPGLQRPCGSQCAHIIPAGPDPGG